MNLLNSLREEKKSGKYCCGTGRDGKVIRHWETEGLWWKTGTKGKLGSNYLEATTTEKKTNLLR